jgi:hypothetical protein
VHRKRQSGVGLVLVMIALAFASTAHARSTSQARQLASAKVQVQSLTRHVHALRGTVNFYQPHHQGHWALHLRYKKCYQVTGWQRVKVCQKARRTLADAVETLPTLEQQLQIRQVHLLYLQIDPSEIDNFTCVHHYEGAWNGLGYVHGVLTYYGGLQMDLGFQNTYGAEFLVLWGTANKWPVEAQYVAAHRAKVGYGGYGARGYGPWPLTAHHCGLI